VLDSTVGTSERGILAGHGKRRDAPLDDVAVDLDAAINPEYETYERDDEEVNIVGRVIWAAKRL
jgi:hypothetical protein